MVRASLPRVVWSWVRITWEYWAGVGKKINNKEDDFVKTVPQQVVFSKPSFEMKTIAENHKIVLY